MTVRVYRSTDTNAEQCSGQAGKLNAILSACLVDGYSPGTVSSITRSGSLATLTFTAAHGMADFNNRLTIAGCTETEYNHEFEVSVISPTEVTFTVSGTPTSPATGAPTAIKAGSGWTKPYTGTNLAAFKQGAGSNGFYLYVNDTGTTDARVIGYETMSSISDTSGNPFPTTAQLSGGGYIRKSSTASTTARSWILIATEKAFYLWIDKGGSTAAAHLHFFGDIISRKIDDAFSTLLAVATQAADAVFGVPAVLTSISTAGSHYMPRSYTQTGASVAVGKTVDSGALMGSTTMGSGGEAYPSPVTGGLLMSTVWVHEAALRRGIMPGLMSPLHVKPLAHLDTFSGVGVDADKKYLSLFTYSNGGCFVEISNTW